MKKFITLPYDVYERLTKNVNLNSNTDTGIKENILIEPLSPQSTTVYTTPENIETRLNTILKRTDLPIDKKRLLYTDILRKYIDINEPAQVLKPIADSDPKEDKFNPLPILSDVLPKTLLRKGNGFVNYLFSNTDISWDKSGSVSINKLYLEVT